MGLDRAFLSLLQGTIGVSSYTGQDAVGNNLYGPETPQKAYVGDVTAVGGGEDGHGKADNHTVYECEIITDAIGLALKDRVRLPSNRAFYVTRAVTAFDEVGGDLYQTSTVRSEEGA